MGKNQQRHKHFVPWASYDKVERIPYSGGPRTLLRWPKIHPWRGTEFDRCLAHEYVVIENAKQESRRLEWGLPQTCSDPPRGAKRKATPPRPGRQAELQSWPQEQRQNRGEKLRASQKWTKKPRVSPHPLRSADGKIESCSLGLLNLKETDFRIKHQNFLQTLTEQISTLRTPV